MENEKRRFMGIHAPCELIDKFDQYVEEYSEREMMSISRSALIRKAMLEFMANHPIKDPKEVANAK